MTKYYTYVPQCNNPYTFFILCKYTHTHTHPFHSPLSRTTRVSRYQKGTTNLDFTEARDSEWLWHQLGHMQVCTSLQTDNHASTPPLVFYRPDALPAAIPTASKHWRQLCKYTPCYKTQGEGQSIQGYGPIHIQMQFVGFLHWKLKFSYLP